MKNPSPGLILPSVVLLAALLGTLALCVYTGLVHCIRQDELMAHHSRTALAAVHASQPLLKRG